MELAENFCQNNQEIIQRIYEKIYKQFNTGVIDVFLCGGTDKISIRNTLRLYLLKNKGIRVLYPEDLFLELLNINKEYNLLELENFLAENCDIVCIICESPGSLVELGAFVNNKNLSEKVVALIEKNKAKKQSFIMLGPIKSLKKMGKYHYSACSQLCYGCVLCYVQTGTFNGAWQCKLDSGFNTRISKQRYRLLSVFFYALEASCSVCSSAWVS